LLEACEVSDGGLNGLDTIIPAEQKYMNIRQNHGEKKQSKFQDEDRRPHRML
jgi:hypothetical protein